MTVEAAGPTRVKTYTGTGAEREAAYQADSAAAAQHGWVPLRREFDAAGMHVTYHQPPKPAVVPPGERGLSWADKNGPIANWPGTAPKSTPPPPGAYPPAFALSQSIARYVARGYRVQSQDAFSAVMVTGHRVNHVLHAILTIFLLGLWLFVWIPMAMFGGERRALLTVDDRGAVHERPA